MRVATAIIMHNGFDEISIAFTVAFTDCSEYKQRKLHSAAEVSLKLLWSVRLNSVELSSV